MGERPDDAQRRQEWAAWREQCVRWLCQQTGSSPRRALAALRGTNWDLERARALLGRGAPGSWDAQRRTGLFVVLAVLAAVLFVGVRSTLLMSQAERRYQQRQVEAEERARQGMPRADEYVARDRCMVCGGRGTMPCPACSNTPPGMAPNPCPMCQGKRTVACMACNGTGRSGGGAVAP